MRKETVTIIKADLAKEVGQLAGLTKAQATSAIDILMQTIIRHVRAGHKITLRGFGRFEKHTYAARVARVPDTKQEIHVPAKDVLHFKATCDLMGDAK